MNFYQNKKILVTGGSGFIGSHLVEKLIKLKAKVTVISRRNIKTIPFLKLVKSRVKIITADLKNQKQVDIAVKKQDYIFHLAAHVGGIHYNNIHPATLLYENVLPALNLLQAAKKEKNKRILIVSSACVYPRFCKIPTPESQGFLKEPEPTNYGYGWAKRFNEIIAKTYNSEFELKVGIVRPYNVYGPRDNFDPKQSHVIPALVKRICDGQNPLDVWGDGSATRSFIFVNDVVEGLLLALDKYPQADPINLGTKEEISIKDLVKLIISISGKKVKIKFDKTKPNGQPRRCCNTKKAEKILGFSTKIKLHQGLPKVVKYYQENVQKKS